MRAWARPCLSVIALVCCSPALLSEGVAQPWDELWQRVRQGQEAMYRLEYKQARDLFQGMEDTYPDSPVGAGMMSILTFNEMIHSSANLALDDYATPNPFESQGIRKPIALQVARFRQSNDALIALCDRLLAKKPDDALSLYFKGLAYENRAAEAVIIARRSGEAIRFGKLARRTHERTLKLDPRLVDANISVAVYDFAAANLPWSIKWIAFLLGYRGDEKGAFRKLKVVSEEGKYRSYDALVLIGLFKAWKGNPQEAGEAVTIFENLQKRFPQNYLIDINLAAIYEKSKLKDPRAALRVYESLLKGLPTKTPGLRPGEVYYRIGKTHLQLRNYSEALAAFQQAVRSPRGEEETEPLSHYYMGVIHEEQGARAEALECYRQVVKHAQLPAIKGEVRRARSRID